MPITVKSDLLRDCHVEEGLTVSRIYRTFQVKGFADPDNAHQAIIDAHLAAGIPAYGDAHPSVDFAYVVNKFTSPYGKQVMKEVQDQCIGSFNGNYPGLRVQKLMKPKYHAFLKIPAIARIVNKLMWLPMPKGTLNGSLKNES